MVLTDNMFKVGESSCIHVKKAFKPKIVIFSYTYIAGEVVTCFGCSKEPSH